MFGHTSVSVITRRSTIFTVAAVLMFSLFGGPPIAAQSRDSWRVAMVCRPDIAEQIIDLTDKRDLVPALELADALLGNAAKELGARSSCAAQALFLRSTVLQVMGRIDDSGPPIDDAVAIFRQQVTPDHPALTLALNNQGAQRFWMRRYEAAAQSHEEALERRRRAVPVDELSVAESLQNLADTYRYLGRTADLLVRMYTEAIAIRSRRLSPDDSLVANCRQNLASAYELAGDNTQAARELTEALRIYRQASPRDDTVIAGILNRRAARLFVQGKYGEAELLFREALTTLRSAEHARKLASAAVLDDFVVNQMHNNNLEEARVLAAEALAVRGAVLPEGHSSFARTLSNLSQIDWQQGRFSLSLEASRKATAITLLGASFDTAARLRLQRHVRAVWWSTGKPEAPTTSELFDEAFTMTQHATRSGTANTVRSLAVRAATSDEKLRASLKEIEDIDREQERLELKLSHAASASVTEDGQKLFSELRASITSAAARRAAAMATVRRDYPRYDQLVRPEPLSVLETQHLLAADEALVLFLVGLDEVYVFAISRETAIMRQIPISPQDLAVSVAKLRTALQIEPTSADRAQQQASLFNLGASHDLYTKLLGGLAPVIAAKSQLIVVPSGGLTSLPFHQLVRTRPKIAQPTRQQAVAYRDADWLVRRHAVTVLPSVESLRALRASPPSSAERRPMVAFANPLPRSDWVEVAVAETARSVRGPPRKRGTPNLWDGGGVQLENLRAFLDDPRHRLPETLDEVNAVARTLRADPKDIITGSAATETTLKQMDLSKYRVVYFATHGFVTGAFGVGEPSLALTAPDTATSVDDGLLTASEIAELKLDADLVVLSACDTAAGDQVGADGLSGLARAFFHAGARSMLVSHWAVDSLDTKAMMQTLFLELEREPTLRRSEALRRAMLARIAGATGKDVWNAYPGRWAPFDLVGAH